MVYYVCDNSSCDKKLRTKDEVWILKKGDKEYILCDKCASTILDKVKSEPDNIKLKTKAKKITEAINEYGQDKLVKEYKDGVYSTEELDDKLGVKHGLVKRYLIKIGVIAKDIKEDKSDDKEGH